MTKINIFFKYFVYLLFILILVLSAWSYINANRMLFNNFTQFGIYVILFCLLILIYRMMSSWIEKYHKVFLIACTVIGTILCCSLFFGNYYVNFDDYASNYNNALHFAKYFQFAEPTNIAMFPHLSGYIILLAFFFALFGISINTVILSNIIFHMCTAVLLYLITKKIFSKKIALITYLFFLINPITLIWCTMPIGVTVFNFFLCFSYYLSFILMEKLEKKEKYILHSLIVGIILSLSNLFRPVMPVFIIALIFTFFLKNKFKMCKQFLVSIIIILFSYIAIGGIHSKIISNIVNQKLPDSKSGWAIYVGAQYEYGGLWNFEASKLVSEKRKDGESASEIQKDLFDLGIQKFKSNGIKNNIELFKYKIITLTGKSGRYTADSYLATKQINSFFDNNYENVKSVIICNFYHFIFLFGTLITALKFLKHQRYEFIFLQLYIIGILIAQLFLETSARYTLSFLIPYFILSFGFLYSTKKNIKLNTMKKDNSQKFCIKEWLKKKIVELKFSNILLFILMILTIAICFLRPLLNFTIQSLFLLLLFVLIIVFLVSFKNKFKNIYSKYIPIIIFGLTFITRLVIALVFKNDLIQLSDFGLAYSNSISLAFNTVYYWTFPHWILYPSILHLVYKILGVSQLSGFIFNSFMISLSAVLIYLISKRIFKNKVASIMSTLFYILWISNILYILIYTPEHVTICLLLLSIYLFIKLLDENVLMKKIYFSILIGLIVGISAFFKDFSSIYIIAFICTIILLLIFKKGKLAAAKNACLIIIMSVVMLTTKNIIFYKIDMNMTNYINRNTENFSLYLGFDREAKGYYTSEIAAEYFDMMKLENYNYKRINIIAKNKFFNDIKDNQAILPQILEAKHNTTTNGDYIKIWLVYESMMQNDSKKSAEYIESLSKINNSYYCMIVFLAIIGIIYLYKKKNIVGFLIPIIILGCVLVLLLIESQERYRYSIETLYCILAGGGIYYIYKLLNNIFMKKNN